jgi:hypothetical protein
MHLNVPISPGEFLDKVAILEIKSERITDAAKLANVRRELEQLRATWAASPLAGRESARPATHAGTAPPGPDVADLIAELKTVNEALWDIEDQIRAREAARRFDEEFVELARSIYRTNDRRAAIKRELNLVLGSDLLEEKSYAGY